jgi:hypothetical protein
MPDWKRRAHNYSQNQTDDGIETTGSLTWWNDSPETSFQIGDNFQPIPGGPTLKVKNISIQSEDTGTTLYGKPITLWHISVEGNADVSSDDTTLQYSFTIAKDDKGIRQVSGTMVATNTGAVPVLQLDLGNTFLVPGIGDVTCTNISGGSEKKSDGSLKWTITYSGSIIVTSITPPPAEPYATNYDVNGETGRTVAGEFVMLRRSTSPIKTATVTLYNNLDTPLTTPGNTYSWGLVKSEAVSPEIIKQDGITIGTYWRHDISIEA